MTASTENRVVSVNPKMLNKLATTHYRRHNSRAKFQSTRPRGARLPVRRRRVVRRGVSIHAPARGATRSCTGRRSLWRCFNPRAREGRDPCRPCRPWRLRRFNPHAREGRDGGRGVRRALEGGVSIHAPARDATSTCLRVSSSPSRFNPRAREGRDVDTPPDKQGGKPVSIHAPARDATCVDGVSARAARSFNPRAREGRDCRPRSRRPGRRCFNPRAREGRDERGY